MTTSLRTELSPDEVALVSRVGADGAALLDVPLSVVTYYDLDDLRHRVADLGDAEGLDADQRLNEFGVRCQALADRLGPWHWGKTPTNPPYRGPVSRTTGWIAWWPIGNYDPISPDDITEESGEYTGYIGAIDEHGREVAVLEEMPELRDITAVLEWIRGRTDHARVRPSWDPSNHYFVGDPDRNPGLPVLNVPTT